MKKLNMMLALTVVLAVFGFVTMANAEEFNRHDDWAASANQAGNSHGTAGEPTGSAWSYWIKPNAYSNQDYVPNELEQLAWNSTGSAFDKSVVSNSPWYRGYGRCYQDRFYAYMSNSSSHDGFTTPFIVAAFQNPFDVPTLFDITGATTWKLATTNQCYGLRMEIAKFSSLASGSKTLLWSYTPSPTSVIGTYDVPDPDLHNVELGVGEYIAFGFKSTYSQNRNVYWYDSGLMVESIPEPATLCLLAIGGIGILVRKKARS